MKRLISDMILLVSGCIISAIAIDIFMVPYRIAPGGLSGVATVIYHLTNGYFSVGLTVFALNVPLFIFGLFFLGREFILKTLLGTFALSLSLDLLEKPSHWFVTKYLSPEGISASSPNMLLYVVCGGFLMGLGLGLVFKAGATTGGSDMAARIVLHFMSDLTMGKLILLIDAFVVLFATVVFQSILLGLYSAIALYLCSKVIDTVLEGVNYSKAVYIISSYPDLIGQKIMSEIGRGVTSIPATGMYSMMTRQMLLCVVHRAQITSLKRLVHSTDKDAFFFIVDIREVLGNFRTRE